MKSFNSLLALLFSFFFLLGFTIQSIAPQFKKFVIIQIEELTAENLPIRFLANDISVSAFPLSVSLLDIKTMIDPKEIPDLQRLTVGRLTLELDVLSMMAGQLTFGDIVIEELNAAYMATPAKPSADGPEDTNAKDVPFDFEIFKELPIENLELINTNLKIQAPDLYLRVDNLNAEVQNQFTSVVLAVYTPEIDLNFEGESYQDVSLKLNGSVDAKTFQLETIGAQYASSKINISGNLNHGEFDFEQLEGTIQSKIDLNARDLQSLIDDTLPMSGTLKAESSLRFGQTKIYSLNADIKSHDLVIDDINLGAMHIGGEYNGDLFRFSNFSIDTNGGQAQFEQATLDMATGEFDSKFNVEKIDLPVFLDAIDVKGVPVDLFIKGAIGCKGHILSVPELTCKGSLGVNDFEVRPKPDAKDNIVKIDKGEITGQFTVGLSKVSYDAHLVMDDTKIHSNGDVIYDKGFKINYQTDRLDFAKLAKIAGMDVEGYAKIAGSVQGDAEDATFAMKVTTEDFYLGDYLLGNLNTDFSFGARTLYFDNVIGSISNSRYRGNVIVDLDKERIRSDMNFPFFDTRSVVRSVARHLPIPFGITGSGTANLNFEGPLEFSKLSYHLKANVFRGSIAGDSYDRIALTLNSKNGHVKVETGELRKNETFILFSGTMTPEFYIDAKFESPMLLLEESETITGLTDSVTGNMAFTSELTGSIYNPTINFKGRLSRVLFADQQVPDSTFGFRLSEETFSGTANILGNRVKGQFTFPLTEDAPFRLTGETNNWDFAALLSLFGGDRFKGEYETKLTSKVDLVASQGGIWNATGSAELTDFLMKRGNQSLSIDKPIQMRFSQGQISIKDFHMHGGDNLVRVEGNDFSKKDLALNINGRIDLRLAHIFLPFLEEIGGPTSFAFKVAGPITNPQVLGSAFIESAYTKVFGVPHLFENIRSDVTFSQSRVLINSVTSDFAKGKIEGSGHIDLQAYGKVPVEVTAVGTNLELEIPPKVVTKGDAELKFAGDWFPYTLSGRYKVDDGTITMEFETTGEESAAQQTSALLPETLLEADFEPIVFDIDVILPPKLRIDNELLDGYITGNVKVTKTPDNPILLGVIEVDPESVLRVRENEFDVKSARAEFNNPDLMDPTLLISAETQKLTDSGTYTIDLLMQGTATEPIYNFTSQPPLDEINIISLLALGITTDSTTAQDDIKLEREVFEQTANLLPITRELQEQLGVKVTFSTTDLEGSSESTQVTIKKEIDNRTTATFTTAIRKKTDSAEVRYRWTDSLSSALRYRSNDISEAQQSADDSTNIFGLDLEYKMEFR